MIYRLVSSGQDSILSIGQERPGEGHSEGTYCFEGFKNVLLRSSLFRVCRQTREGLAFFYEQHCIKLFVEHGGCLVAFIDWLDIMGRENAQRIRHLEIHFKTKCCKSDKIHMDRIHERLSDQATVVYIPNDVEDLWYIGRAYYLEHLQSGRAPLFKVVGISFNGSHFYNMETRDYRTGPWFRFLARKGSSMEYSMAFNPGESWFG